MFVATLLSMPLVVSAVFAQAQAGSGGPPRRLRFSPEEGINQMLAFWEKQLNITLTDEQRKAIQNAFKERFDAFIKLVEARRNLMALLRAGATDAQLKTAIENYENAIKAYEKRLEEIEDELNAKLNYKANPKLHALLIVTGALGRYGGMMFGRFGGAGGWQMGPRGGGQQGGQRQQGQRGGQRRGRT
jgi:Spy/CpxP family protein refolding chaperone